MHIQRHTPKWESQKKVNEVKANLDQFKDDRQKKDPQHQNNQQNKDNQHNEDNQHEENQNTSTQKIPKDASEYHAQIIRKTIDSKTPELPNKKAPSQVRSVRTRRKN